MRTLSRVRKSTIIRAADHIQRLVGKQVRKIRLSRGLTIDTLAVRAGITKGFLSKIERGQKAPAIATLVNLAIVLNTEVSQLLDAQFEKGRVSLVRKRERAPAIRYASAFGYKYTALAHKIGRKHMEPFVVSYPPNPRRSGPGLRHAGEEFILALKGRIQFTVGNRRYVLEPGDALYYDSHIPHWARSLTQEDAEALDITFVPAP